MSNGVIELKASGAVIGTETPIRIIASERSLSAERATSVFITGAPGTVDESFGTLGKASFPLLTSRPLLMRSGALLLMGRIANTVTLLKLSGEGSEDFSFGSGGYLSLGFPGGLQREQSSGLIVVEQGDGKLLVITSLDDAGTAGRPDYLAVARLLPNGSIDQAYGALGYVLDPLPNRPYAAALGPDGELLLWNGAASDTRLTRISSTGAIGASSPTYDTSVLVHVFATMVVQPDGKAVIPAYAPGLEPALFRFTTALAMDSTFGRAGKLVTNLFPFSLHKLSDNSYAAASSVGNPAAPAVMRFDAAWRSFPGFESGFVAFPPPGTFDAHLSMAGATLVAGTINNAARIGRVLDNGMIDQRYGVDGLTFVEPLATGDGVRALVEAPPFGIFVVISRGTTLNTNLIRIWQ